MLNSRSVLEQPVCSVSHTNCLKTGLLGLIVVVTGCSDIGPASLSDSELNDIYEADRAYATAWLANDTEMVMGTLTSDAVIVPSGMQAIEGENAIRQFWWPEDSPPTHVSEFTLVQHEAGGFGDIGFVRGSFSLGFDYDGTAFSSRGEYFCLLRRGPDEVWRISHRMWNDRPADQDR